MYFTKIPADLLQTNIVLEPLFTYQPDQSAEIADLKARLAKAVDLAEKARVQNVLNIAFYGRDRETNRERDSLEALLKQWIALDEIFRAAAQFVKEVGQ